MNFINHLVKMDSNNTYGLRKANSLFILVNKQHHAICNIQYGTVLDDGDNLSVGVLFCPTG